MASAAAGGAARSWSPPDCAGGSSPADAARQIVPAEPAAMAGLPWFRVDPQIDDRGELASERVITGIQGGPVLAPIDLPPESFAAGPFGRAVLAGSDDGATSRLLVIDVAASCAFRVAAEAGVIRRATIDPSGESIYETRVDRGSRADLGVWRRPIDSGGPPVLVLPPLAEDDRFGRTFSTEFTWAIDGASLAVQACGPISCRTRVLDVARGVATTLDDPGLGPLVGIADGRIITYAACRGLPCPLLSVDLAGGPGAIVSPAAAAATVVRGPSSSLVVREEASVRDETSELVVSDTRGDGATRQPAPAGLHLVAAGPGTGAGSSIPSGWVALAGDGRVPATGAVHALLRRPSDGRTVDLTEVLR
ncbi:MAG: hypothetical protein ACJ761_05800 [Chloroflexota bacterium]